MDYETAKKLKEAGFQKEHDMDYGIDCCKKCEYRIDYGAGGSGIAEMCYPNLSELIESCGNSFETLTRIVKDVGGETNWFQAWAFGAMTAAVGTTPEIAMANLWLRLNKK